MTLESIAPMSDNTTVELPDMAAYRPFPPDTAMAARLLHHGSGHDHLKNSCAFGLIRFRTCLITLRGVLIGLKKRLWIGATSS